MRSAFGLAFGAMFGLAAWRNLPTLDGQFRAAFVVLVFVGLWASWSAGRYWRLRDNERAVAVASATAAAEVRAELKANAASTAQAAAVVNVHQGPELITAEQVVEQWFEDSEEEMDLELAAHYANEMNRATLKQHAERSGTRARGRPIPRAEGADELPPKVLYLPSSSHRP